MSIINARGNRVCEHCGESVPVLLCPICSKDLSDLAYHSGIQYALDGHFFEADDEHFEYYKDTYAK